MTSKKSFSEGNPYPDIFNVSLGGYLGFSSCAKWEKDHLMYSSAKNHYEFDTDMDIKPSNEKWLEFWKTIEKIGVWNWSGEYTNNNVLDGTNWSLNISYKDRTVSVHGSNAYPGSEGPEYSKSFSQFIDALNALMGDDQSRLFI